MTIQFLAENVTTLYKLYYNLFEKNCFSLVLSEQQRSQDAPPATSRSRASDSGGDARHTPPSNADNGPQPPSSKPGWAEEGGSGWGGQGAPPNYQVVC